MGASMDWESPKLLLLVLPALLLLLWIEGGSAHPMSAARRRLLLVVRALGVLLALAALAGPARVAESGRASLGILVDVSQSLGAEGAARALAEAERVRAQAGGDSFVVPFAARPELRRGDRPETAEAAADWRARHGGDSHYAAAVEFARSLFPPGASRTLLVIGDGHETRGSLLAAAREAALAGVRLHALPLAGPLQPDARLLDLTPSRPRLQEGATLQLAARLESTLAARGRLRLYEDGVEIDSRVVELQPGAARTETFTRTPAGGSIHRYRAVLEEVPGDAIAANNAALALVDVRGRLRLLALEGDPTEGGYLVRAMAKEGMEIELRAPGQFPTGLEQLAGYDGVLLSDVPAHRLGEPLMNALRDYVDKLGGGLVMLGGPESFGLGGYHQTPVGDLLPVRLKAPDEEEKQSAAIALVIDRSGSMAGERLEMAKSAAIATAEVLGRNDLLSVHAFDSEAHLVVPMTRLASPATVAGQISALASGGGTNLEPAFRQAREALLRARARVRHMIILTDGQTAGGGYENLAAQCRGEGITISTVAIGEGSHVALLQAIAAGGGGQAYSTLDPAAITRIFTQDTLLHAGRMLREEPFEAQVSEKHPMLAGLEAWGAPPLLGHVKTLRKTTAQVPLLTDLGDPLLAHWRYGLGKVTAFTSDAKSRWASLWIARWPDFSRFWAQVLRETARPPQGRQLDLALQLDGDVARLRADRLVDAGTRANDARVDAEVFFVAADALGAPLQSLHKLRLEQTGPGLYEGSFRPDQPGVYLVRAQSGADLVSAGLVHNPGSEAGLGNVNEALLAEATRLTGGRVLAPGEVPPLDAARSVEHRELWPDLLLALLLLFLIDTAVRRWEHVAGFWQALRPAPR
jgi:uncharacterized membrane protein